MITNFEEITADLSKKERELLPIFLQGLRKKVGKEKAVTATTIARMLKEKKNISVGGPRIRKIINYIRVHGMLPGLIATSLGYYISFDPNEVQSYVKSLEEREGAIRTVRKKTELWLLQLVSNGNNKKSEA